MRRTHLGTTPGFDPERPDAPARIRWRVRDADDLGVEDARPDAAFAAADQAWRRRRRRSLPRPPAFRQAPVPFTGRGGGGIGFHRSRTAAEIAANATAADDGFPARGRRRNLRRHVERSWKAHRRTQWR
jgi:hypothetical protein